MPKQRLSEDCAQLIFGAFQRYNEDFRSTTQRTGRCFQLQDWAGVQACAVERIDLYDVSISQTLWKISGLLEDLQYDEEVWSLIKARYLELISPQIDKELHKTYFNSMTRRTFRTIGVNPGIEFVNIHRRSTDGIEKEAEARLYEADRHSLASTAERILSDYALQCPFAEVKGCAGYIDSQIRALLDDNHGPVTFTLLKPHFFRGTRAYIVGRMCHQDETRPFVVALMHQDDGLAVDAVLTSANSVSILFGFTRSYLHVDLETVGDTVLFLEKVLPRKSIDEIYTVLGRAKQGKTERYRSLFRHLESAADETFVVAPGSKGMVMAVFTLPSYDLVFKVIRDRFAYPKTVVRQEVLDSYELVFKHDRAGRLVDAQEFKQLTFKRSRFSEPVLEELLTENSNSVIADRDTLTIKHLYIERRITPLNLYLRDAEPEQAREIITDYGQAIKDLSRCNIFPGDLLLKNFGVSRHDRVIFYDYDELCLVTDCNFRRIPGARYDAEEFNSEVWFEVGPNDIFPEQFVSFLGLNGEQLGHLREQHGDILTAEYWEDVKHRLQAGEVLDFAPYGRSRYA